jgi:hypothetical protein
MAHMADGQPEAARKVMPGSYAEPKFLHEVQSLLQQGKKLARTGTNRNPEPHLTIGKEPTKPATRPPLRFSCHLPRAPVVAPPPPSSLGNGDKYREQSWRWRARGRGNREGRMRIPTGSSSLLPPSLWWRKRSGS